MFNNRSTIDIVIILLAAMVGSTIIITIIGAVILKILHPEIDLKGPSEVVSNVLTTVVGALVGFIGGRAIGRTEGNGK